MNKLSLIWTCVCCLCFFTNCNDEYFYENNIPENLGKSIYDYLQNDGNFTTYIQLIDDLDYTEVLSKTGSKTLFVVDDETFSRFFENNPWGVKKYEELALSQKQLILNSSMINNALLIEGLSTIEGPVKGQVLRRTTAASVWVGLEKGEDLPDNVYWDRFRTNGIYLAKDATPIPMLHFLEAQMTSKNMTDNDFSILFNGAQRAKDDAYIYNIKVKQRDIICQNGYIHVLEEVLIPPSNMAEVIRTAPETQMFSSLLERFAAPYYSSTLTAQHQQLGGTDSVFVKGYFSTRSGTVTYNATNKTVMTPNGSTVANFLLYDPGWNLYKASETVGSFQTDMAAIFAPTNEALQSYFSVGSGRALIDRYGDVKNIPNEVLDKLVKNHMQTEFLSTLPSRFQTIVDDAQERMGIETSHIEKVYLTANGAVYVVNTVYPPALYSSVMFPAVINENIKVFNWAIEQLNFDAYLLSMVNYYSFLLPKDNFTYIVPTSLQHNQPEAWKFHYDYTRNAVYASVHPYDTSTHEIGDSINVVTTAATLKDHLEDMLDYHIVVGNIEDGKEFYRTKGGGTIRISRSGSQIEMAGGGDIERNTSLTVQDVYDQTKETNGRGNGKTYVLNQPMQSPLNSVYSILSTTSEFNDFFELLKGNDDLWTTDKVKAAKFSIFYKDLSQAGMDFNVRFLNTFHYTLYVPTNEAVQRAIQSGLPTWGDVEAATNQEEREAKAEKIIRFLRYHFQDNAVYLDKPSLSASYETATLNTNTDTFYKLNLTGENYSLNIKTASGGTAGVKTDKGLFNIMARDFKFNTANPATATTIETSSYIVIHQIDDCLYFEK
ncbi:MAG: hypothetical protein EZS26_000939 [Candidatus Ordinivivax streblomastigis]|uniref:FAS1 domain-containing protein n=1 Tax=Candidatus Ordinivivax streblomastigis TaxID=2540710 RepID=A0A5M8P2T2_9BACT|nr:MAG: hypothetical protein EZS26_000939 [Candidatus Ordinivivax streblomastigis]